MTEKRFRVQEHCLRSSYGIEAENWLVTNDNHSVALNDKAEAHMVANMCNDVIDLLNALHEENEQLKSDLKDCRKLKTKRLNKIRNHRAVIEDLGGSIRAYKGKIEQTNEKIDKIKEAMEDTGVLTKRQLEEILND